MIDEKTKKKLLKELAKSGNVYITCLKTGVDKATYYRWKKEDKRFHKFATAAERMGRSNKVDVAEHALMIRVNKGDMSAIKYVLSHLSDQYRPKEQNIFFHHSADSDKMNEFKSKEREHWDAITEAWKELTELVRSKHFRKREKDSVHGHLSEFKKKEPRFNKNMNKSKSS